jgi:hypothetical protein
MHLHGNKKGAKILCTPKIKKFTTVKEGEIMEKKKSSNSVFINSVPEK